MTRLIVLFNLKPDVTVDDYERWVGATEYPVVRALDSIASYDVHATIGLLGSDGRAPYQYVELIDVTDMQRFAEDAGSDAMQDIVAAFGRFADAPVFMLTRDVGVAAPDGGRGRAPDTAREQAPAKAGGQA